MMKTGREFSETFPVEEKRTARNMYYNYRGVDYVSINQRGNIKHVEESNYDERHNNNKLKSKIISLHNMSINENINREGEISNEDDGNKKSVLSFEKINFGMQAFYAMLKPVTLAMILTSLSVIYVTTEEIQKIKSEQLTNASTVWNVDELSNSSLGTKLGFSFLNGIIIILVITLMTFIIVLLYKYRCMKILVGYIGVSVFMLLGVMGYDYMMTVLSRYNSISMDVSSFVIVLYNFSIVGIISIFFSNKVNVPDYITQGYLIITSVLLAWQLSNLNQWTAWVLLVLLAFYDLFAVLTPCGPLKLLVNLMSKDNAPMLPGLLYEASLPDHAQRPVKAAAMTNRPQAASSSVLYNKNKNNESQDTTNNSTGVTAAALSKGGIGMNSINVVCSSSATSNGSVTTDRTIQPYNIEQQQTEKGVAAESNTLSRTLAVKAESTRNSLSPAKLSIDRGTGEVEMTPTLSTQRQIEQQEFDRQRNDLEEQEIITSHPTEIIPLAIARYYRLVLVEEEKSRIVPSRQKYPNLEELTTEQLRSNVRVIFPPQGGRIKPSSVLLSAKEKKRRNSRNDNQTHELTQFTVSDRQGNVERILYVNKIGKVFQITKRPNDEDEKKRKKNSIKLGLGDFIFYSLLASKAAIDGGFVTCVVCMVIILIGLKSTLLQLAIAGKALPALPISVLLGVTFYFLSEYILQPYIREGVLFHCSNYNDQQCNTNTAYV